MVIFVKKKEVTGFYEVNKASHYLKIKRKCPKERRHVPYNAKLTLD